MIILDGKQTATSIQNEIKAELELLIHKYGKKPGLAVILVGDDPASQVYVRNKEKACLEVGFNSILHKLSAKTTQSELEALISKLNEDHSIDGILLQLPLPKGLDSQHCLECISPNKDVDGLHPLNIGKLTLGLEGFRSCTPAGVMTLLKRYNLSAKGKKAVVVGRSNIVGKPLALMLAANDDFANATVTLCHSQTPNLKDECLQADILVLALGKAEFCTADMVKPGAIVIDVGINRTTNGLKGDCHFESVKTKASAITPVPGGVGPMTIATLLMNTLQAYKKKVQINF